MSSFLAGVRNSAIGFGVLSFLGGFAGVWDWSLGFSGLALGGFVAYAGGHLAARAHSRRVRDINHRFLEQQAKVIREKFSTRRAA